LIGISWGLFPVAIPPIPFETIAVCFPPVPAALVVFPRFRSHPSPRPPHVSILPQSPVVGVWSLKTFLSYLLSFHILMRHPYPFVDRFLRTLMQFWLSFFLSFAACLYPFTPFSKFSVVVLFLWLTVISPWPPPPINPVGTVLFSPPSLVAISRQLFFFGHCWRDHASSPGYPMPCRTLNHSLQPVGISSPFFLTLLSSFSLSFH